MLENNFTEVTIHLQFQIYLEIEMHLKIELITQAELLQGGFISVTTKIG